MHLTIKMWHKTCVWINIVLLYIHSVSWSICHRTLQYMITTFDMYILNEIPRAIALQRTIRLFRLVSNFCCFIFIAIKIIITQMTFGRTIYVWLILCSYIKIFCKHKIVLMFINVWIRSWEVRYTFDEG